MLSRRQALALLPALFFSTAWRRVSIHPTPRKGITSAAVIKARDLSDASAEVVAVFEGIRTIPHVADGIYCYCGCADMPDHYSLLSCFEGDGMAQGCQICQGEGRLVYELHRKGKSLSEIRGAIDRNFG